MSNVQEALNIANPNSLPDMARRVELGDIVAGLIPRVAARTGLASSATQVEPEPGAILAVTDTAGTTAITMVTGTAGAGEVTVSYDTDGVATLVFGSGAVLGRGAMQCLFYCPHCWATCFSNAQ